MSLSFAIEIRIVAKNFARRDRGRQCSQCEGIGWLPNDENKGKI
jgi:hypothetical protein